MDIIRLTIKGALGYGISPHEFYEDKIILTDSSISYEYKPHPMARLETNTYKKWSYKTTSPIFKQIFKEITEKTPHYLYNEETLFVTDVGPTEIIATFEDKHKESVIYFCSNEFFREYFNLIKKLVPQMENTPTVLLTKDDFAKEK